MLFQRNIFFIGLGAVEDGPLFGPKSVQYLFVRHSCCQNKLLASPEQRRIKNQIAFLAYVSQNIIVMTDIVTKFLLSVFC